MTDYKWYILKLKDGTHEVFRAHAADMNNGYAMSFFGVIFSDHNAEFYHVMSSEVISVKEIVTGEVIDDIRKSIGDESDTC